VRAQSGHLTEGWRTGWYSSVGVARSGDGELLDRVARDVPVLWDEAQDSPALLRFLAPFGRPDLGRIERTLRGASSLEALLVEPYPVFATWLATLLKRARVTPPAVRGLEASLTLEADLSVDDARLVVAGDLTARVVRVRGTLVVAGDVRCRLLLADGCVLIGGRLEADFVSAPATEPRRGDRRRVAGAVGLHVATALTCQVFDSPRFALSCPISARVVTRAAGLPVTPRAGERLRELLADGVSVERELVDFEQVAARLAAGQPVLR
jgi:hypothetical protein